MVVNEQDKPVFDRNRLTWQQAKARDVAAMRLKFYAHKLDGTAITDIDEFEQALKGYADALAVIEHTLGLILVSVPRDWLTPDAPENIDWSDPVSFQWMLEQKFMLLRTYAQADTTPEGMTGN